MKGTQANEQQTIGDELIVLAAGGLNAEEIVRLMRLRLRIREARLPEPTNEMKHLAFARWLYRHGQISG